MAEQRAAGGRKSKNSGQMEAESVMDGSRIPAAVKQHSRLGGDVCDEVGGRCMPGRMGR